MKINSILNKNYLEINSILNKNYGVKERNHLAKRKKKKGSVITFFF